MTVNVTDEIIFLVLQFLEEEKYKESARKLEKESGLFFNLKYFEECVLNGEWDEVDKYLAGFTRINENPYSSNLFFEIRKQKYLEFLEKGDLSRAGEILKKEFKVFKSFDEGLVKEFSYLITLDNFREDERLAKYGDIESERVVLLINLKKMINENPVLKEKLQFPIFDSGKLRSLINQSLNGQHSLCKNPRSNADITSMSQDHSCRMQPVNDHSCSMQPNEVISSVPTAVNDHSCPMQPNVVISSVPTAVNPNTNPILKPRGFLPVRARAPNQPATPQTSMPHAAPLSTGAPSKRPRDPPSNKKQVRKRPRTIRTSDEHNGNIKNLADVNPKNKESTEEVKVWKPIEINEPSEIFSLKIPDSSLPVKVCKLVYTIAGDSILALTSNGAHMIWEWPKLDGTSAKATTCVPPLQRKPRNSNMIMTNHLRVENPEAAIHCFCLSNNEDYLLSASGGMVSLFSTVTFKTLADFMPPPPTITFLAFNPEDNNIVAMGMDDFSIVIYNIMHHEVKVKLRGHYKRITGLAFSKALNVLVSSGADAYLVVWGIGKWEKQAAIYLQKPADTMVQFHNDQIHMLVVHETELAIFKAPKLECLKLWYQKTLITSATFSCDGRMIYMSLRDGSLAILTDQLELRCRISPAAYLKAEPSPSTYPLVVAAHLSEPDQFTVGLTQGGIRVLEPLIPGWGCRPPPLSDSANLISTVLQPPSS